MNLTIYFVVNILEIIINSDAHNEEANIEASDETNTNVNDNASLKKIVSINIFSYIYGGQIGWNR